MKREIARQTERLKVRRQKMEHEDRDDEWESTALRDKKWERMGSREVMEKREMRGEKRQDGAEMEDRRGKTRWHQAAQPHTQNRLIWRFQNNDSSSLTLSLQVCSRDARSYYATNSSLYYWLRHEEFEAHIYLAIHILSNLVKLRGNNTHNSSCSSCWR